MKSANTNASFSGWSGSVSDSQQSKIPLKIGIATGLGALLWLGPYLGVNAVLLPAKVEQIAPGNKATIVALLATSAMIIATLANVIIGGLSDLTRSRWGRRTPWIIAGSIGSCVMLVVFNMVSSIPALVGSWCVYQIFLNAIVAPLIAVISDRVAPMHRGTISSIYAFGYVIGQYGGQVVGAQFLTTVGTGIVVMGLLTLLSGPLAAIIMREPPSIGMPKKQFTWRMFVQNFIFPIHDAGDFYLALFGKMLISTATTAIMGYQLYILSDYILLNTGGQQKYVSIISTLLMITAIVMSISSGTISDRIKSRKIPVFVSALMVAVGVFMPAFTNAPWTMIVYGALAGLGMGIFFSVDQALNLEVLPNEQNAAKDLGILNLANTGSQILGPIVAASIVTIAGGSYYWIFPVCAVLSLAGGILVLFIKRVK
ncbi:MFS transporter [Sporolactobacillus shoreicorticis]|uniref:MFS transporter n=1 Tax=Sporolactobacillus shoreicorticis TaxID=1923877 RepID=A0ABW5RZ06_9BACL|nr:MFS transporter [Sporolactobacillus shoreicorticis]MCO7125161.1 MFS transporter [Sporolactobacillus shoreicorticis]